MTNDKKIPNGNQSNNLMSKDTEMVLLGVMLSLVSLIGLLNTGPVGHFLFFIFAYAFGVFCFLPFLLFLVYGLYLIIKRRSYHVRINLSLLGFILLLMGFVISSSTSETLVLKNMLSEFKMSSFDIKPFAIESLSDTVSLGGGFVGYFLAALLNTAFTNIGTTIVYILLILVGASLIIYNPIKSFVDFIKFRVEKKKVAKENQKLTESKIVKEEMKVVRKEPTEDENDDSSFLLSDNSYFNLNPTSRDPFKRPVVTAEKAFFKPQEETFNPIKEKETVSLSDKKDDDFPILANDIDEDPVLISQSSNQFLNIQKEEKPTNSSLENIMVDDEELETKSSSSVSYDLKSTINLVDDTFSHSQPIPVIKNSKVEIIEEEDDFVYPSPDLLNEYINDDVDLENKNASIVRQDKINAIFKDLQIGARISGYRIGPSVTRFEVLTDPNVSVSTVSKYIDDIAVRLGGVNARFEKVVSGMNTSGLEIPNKKSTMVSFKECILPYLNNKKEKYKIPLGKNITGEVVSVNLTDFPHLLVAGATGSGKSIFVHNVIMSLIMKTKPSDLKILLIDPKHVEMGKYKEMPHLLCPIITDTTKARVALNKLVKETDERYCMFEEAGVSKISQYNEYAKKHNLKPLPVIVIIIDEYADLVESCKDVSVPVVKLAQKSRAAGIHMIISTQRPSVNVITGVIKANLPTRVALRVAQPIDSITILGEGGAEKLLGYGDLLVDSPEIEGVGLTRLQCPYVDNSEIKRVVEFLKDNYPTNFSREFLDLNEKTSTTAFNEFGDQIVDERYEEVKEFVLTLNEVSGSLIQRKFGFGYNRAARIFDKLKEEGIVAENPSGGTAAKCKVIGRKGD